MAKPLEPSVKHTDKFKRSRPFAECKMVKRVRIVCSDPYATESSGDEAESEVVARKIKRNVCEINFCDPLCLDWSSVEGCRRSGKKPNKRVLAKAPLSLERRVLQDFGDGNAKKRPNRSLYRGVRQRNSGKWAAEIRNPFEQKRLWLGTYNSAEEASRVYEAKRQEFVSKARNMSKYNSEKKVGGLSDDAASRFLRRRSVVREDSESTLAHATSPSSVLELKTTAANDNFDCDGLPKECEAVDDYEDNEVMEGCSTADSLPVEDPFMDLNYFPLDPEIDSRFFDDFRKFHEFSDHYVFPVYDLEFKGDVQLHDYFFDVEEFPLWMNLSA